MAKKKQRPAPPHEQTVDIPAWDDACLMCGVCDVDKSTACAQCGKPLCDECRSKAGRCGLCETYNLPENFTVIPETATGMKSHVGIMLNSHALADIPKPHVFWYDDPKLFRVATVNSFVCPGIGVHYHTNIEDDEDPIWCAEEDVWVTVRDHHEERARWYKMNCDLNTPKAAAAWVRKELIKHYKKKPTYVIIQSSEVRQWFYKEGD